MNRAALALARLALALSFALPIAHAAEPADAPIRLRVVGGLAGLNQFTQNEAPFWQKTFPALTQGRAVASIVPFDKAGIRAFEMLRLIQLGVVPFGTIQLAGIQTVDPELAAVDLAGLNPDMGAQRRSVTAFRAHLEQFMRERHGVEVLAVYAYPAQVTFCRHPFKGLSDLAGRRVRISSPTQSDLIRSFGAVPVQTEFSEIVSNMRSGNVDCAITGAMSGNAIGLHEVATHLQGSATTWGLSVFGANLAAWQALPPAIQAVLRAELPKLEQAIWAESDRQTQEGLACNLGRAGCAVGRSGHMQEVPSNATDEKKLREAFRSSVLPAWVERCGKDCVSVWNRLLAPVSGIRAEPPGPRL